MAAKGIKIGLVMVLVTMFWAGTAAQSSCTTAIIGLSPCLNYITGNSSTPSSSCCSQLDSVVKSQPQCLCTVLNGGGATLGITINQTRALELPGACNVKTPSISACNSAGGPTTTPVTSPVGSPITSPADSSNETPDSSITPSASSNPSGTGSKTVPSTRGDASDGSIIELPLHLAIFLLFIASCTSALTSF